MDAESFEKLFNSERSRVREIVGARGMEYLWIGRTYADKRTLEAAIKKRILADYPTDEDQQRAARVLQAFSSSGPARAQSTVATPMSGFTSADLLYGIAGALLFGSVAIGLEIIVVLGIAELIGGRLSPRGLGWIVFPVMAMVGGFKIGPILAVLISEKTKDAIKIGEVRLLLAGCAFWVLAVLLFVWMFQPFGYYMRDRDYWTVAKVIAFPVILGGAGLGLIGWLRRSAGPR